LLTTVFWAGLETYEGERHPIGVAFLGTSGVDVVTSDVAGSDEAAIQTPEAPLAQRDGVIDGQRSHEAHATVKAAHLTGSLATIEPAVTAVSPRSKDAIDSSLDRPAARATLRYLSATVGGLDVPRQALR